jgi:hypothetical protein
MKELERVQLDRTCISSILEVCKALPVLKGVRFVLLP